MIWNFLYRLNPWLEAILVLGVVLTAALLLQAVIVRLVPDQSRRAHNELLGHTAGIAGVINAVLLAFIVFAAWTDYDRARDVVSQEVSLVTDILRDVEAVSSVHDSVVHGLQGYLAAVADSEWAVMRAGVPQGAPGRSGFGSGWRSLNRSYLLALQLDAGTALQRVVAEELVKRFNSLFDVRRQRIAYATYGALTSTVWGVVLAGGIVSIACCGLFGVESHRLHIASTALVAASFGLVFFLIISLQWPFRGHTQITVDPYCRAWNSVDRDERAEAAEKQLVWTGSPRPASCPARPATPAPAATPP